MGSTSFEYTLKESRIFRNRMCDSSYFAFGDWNHWCCYHDTAIFSQWTVLNLYANTWSWFIIVKATWWALRKLWKRQENSDYVQQALQRRFVHHLVQLGHQVTVQTDGLLAWALHKPHLSFIMFAIFQKKRRESQIELKLAHLGNFLHFLYLMD